LSAIGINENGSTTGWDYGSAVLMRRIIVMHIASIGIDLGKTTFHLVALGERTDSAA
jgi:hypothetical protein